MHVATIPLDRPSVVKRPAGLEARPERTALHGVVCARCHIGVDADIIVRRVQQGKLYRCALAKPVLGVRLAAVGLHGFEEWNVTIRANAGRGAE